MLNAETIICHTHLRKSLRSPSLDAFSGIPYVCFSDSRLKCRDGATSDFGIGWFTDNYVIWCGLLAKKLPKIHTGNKWYLIINVL